MTLDERPGPIHGDTQAVVKGSVTVTDRSVTNRASKGKERGGDGIGGRHTASAYQAFRVEVGTACNRARKNHGCKHALLKRLARRKKGEKEDDDNMAHTPGTEKANRSED